MFLAFARDETMMGFGFPKEWREAALAAEPGGFVRPKTADLRYNWLVVRLAAIDHDEMYDLVTEAWSICVPQKVVDEWMALSRVFALRRTSRPRAGRPRAHGGRRAAAAAAARLPRRRT